MRFLAVIAAFGVALIASAVAPADAAKKKKTETLPTRYCLMYRGGGESCGFFSMQQCREAASGSGGMCVVAAQQDVRPKGKLAPVKDLSPRDDDDDED